MAKKPKKIEESRKCKQCGVETCVELWLICAKCAEKNAEYRRQIDKDRFVSPYRWSDAVVGLPPRK